MNKFKDIRGACFNIFLSAVTLFMVISLYLGFDENKPLAKTGHITDFFLAPVPFKICMAFAFALFSVFLAANVVGLIQWWNRPHES